MGYVVKILCDSLAPSGKRLTTFELSYPRFVHAELMTHRAFSRNSASSRAIPIEKMISLVMEDPAMPVFWGKNKSGMQAEVELEGAEKEQAIAAWLEGRDQAVALARRLVALKVHKQIANRPLETWMYISIIATATDFGNWFNLRTDPAAQPEIRKLAVMMADAYHAATPKSVQAGEWHLPLIQPDEEGLDIELKKKLSAARSARVSYLTHSGTRDLEADLTLHERLISSGHWSPLEHVGQALTKPDWSGNFQGWAQYRKQFPGENRPEFEWPNEPDLESA